MLPLKTRSFFSLFPPLRLFCKELRQNGITIRVTKPYRKYSQGCAQKISMAIVRDTSPTLSQGPFGQPPTRLPLGTDPKQADCSRSCTTGACGVFPGDLSSLRSVFLPCFSPANHRNWMAGDTRLINPVSFAIHPLLSHLTQEDWGTAADSLHRIRLGRRPRLRSSASHR